MSQEYKHYVPMLKTKVAEMNALRDLASQDNVTPLVEITIKSAGGKRSRINSSSIAKSWFQNRAFFLDLEEDQWLSPSIFNQYQADFYALGKRIIPVTSLTRPLAYQNSVQQAFQKHQNGMCLRLSFAELSQNYQKLLSQLGCKIEDCDLIIDLGELKASNIAMSLAALKSQLQNSSDLQSWRRVILAAGSFPFNLNHVNPSSVVNEDRADWMLWSQLVYSKLLARLPMYADYAINHPKLPEVTSQAFSSSPNIRYAIDNEWVIYKSFSTTKKGKNGHAQYNDLCKALVAESYYCGQNFSAGDNYIFDCASGVDGPGNATNWRQAGFSHHFEFVLNQIANLP